MAKYTNKQALINTLRTQLENNATVAAKACSRIFEYQTENEKVQEVVKYNNGVGFTQGDAGILSSFAKQINRGKQLSEKQVYILKKRMPKYAGQLVTQSIEKGLIKYINGVYITDATPIVKSIKDNLTEEIRFKNMYAAQEAAQERRAYMTKLI